MNGSMLPAAAAAAVLVLDGLRLRARLRAIPSLPARNPVVVPSPPARHPVPVTASSAGSPIYVPADREPVTPPGDGTDRFVLVTAAGVTVDERTHRQAVAHAEREGLAVLDLVPADLPMAQTFTLARQVDPATYRTDPLAPGRGAGQALLVDAALAARAGVRSGDGHDPATMIRITDRLKKYAAADAGLLVTPEVAAVPADPATFRARLRAATVSPHATLAIRLYGYLLLATAIVLDPAWGLLALAGYVTQPYLVTAGTGLRPADRLRAAWLRPVRDPLRWWRCARGTWRSPYDRQMDERRAHARTVYARDLADGTGRFFEPRRDDCPWCGGTRLRRRLTSPDRIMGKPGSFSLERCGDCGHLFQNPRLNAAGLEFYYRDVYDGLGASGSEKLLAGHVDSYRGRVTMVRAHTSPRRWLDVGTGWGHFCRYAAPHLPGTVFDGLDMGDGVLEAQRRGWIDLAHQGMFPASADRLTGHYDVISMHHYLEHTLDPRAEIGAAARALPPGGHLLIEVPNPRFGPARLLRSLWLPYFQPQHLNLIALPRLVEAVAAQGLTVVATDTGRAHQPCDLSGALALWLNSRFPEPDRPWLPVPATRLSRARHSMAWSMAIPALVLAAVTDRLLAAAIAPTSGGNCYRLLARKPVAG
ncbi:class I SAM-dependent methyltransferase [Actinoplanes flavus]|uniref:Class I SAM-dependent methyltransferase n=1 Tax=Actinoplanes flavus TaxID=2820290 RepID=A0ABS3UZU0_9ACTN|nr:class I SAM-dependent methyltransferase [Actinoplanes flavus]MBO3744059.1 class I SAM-dependent methyltransferase [Actinoplanes flavus]